ncbi:DUF4232 domain-containing protein [Streptomyces finlayi]|uniref:DUF4232 domain-containing protein n=1 Tax=Streptomyces finlayi TaxID=67296 RepID=A0A7G7BLU6_9ACTN|nr:DUF4232 domain-containing protein [Streptomyces finlayi]QNE76311.1 DUF4232 domain-containing protein [Streptomyces finlayi]
MRTYRHRSALLTAATTAALALALTACGGDASGTKSAGPADSGSASATAEDSAPGGGGAPADDTGTPQDTAAAQTTGTGTAGTGASGAAPVCTTEDVSISAARQDGPPYTHIVLTAKNTSGQSCTIKGFPKVQFLESHKENVPAVAKSKPAAPVVLPAGAPAYALVKLSDGGVDEENEPVSAFSVQLEGGDHTATVQAPGSGGIAVDPAVWATGYWTPELRNGADDF